MSQARLTPATVAQAVARIKGQKPKPHAADKVAAGQLPKPLAAVAAKHAQPSVLHKKLERARKSEKLMAEAAGQKLADLERRMRWLEHRATQTRIGSNERDRCAAEYLVVKHLHHHLKTSPIDRQVTT